LPKGIKAFKKSRIEYLFYPCILYASYDLKTQIKRYPDILSVGACISRSDL